MGSWILLFLRPFRKKRNEDQKEEKEELPTVRQSLIKLAALIITAFVGLMVLQIMDYISVLFSKLAGS